MSDHALGRTAAECIQNTITTGRRHGNEIDVEFDRNIDDSFWDIARSKNYMWQRGSASGRNPYGGRRTPYMEKMQDIMCTTGQKCGHAVNGPDSLPRCGRKINWH